MWEALLFIVFTVIETISSLRDFPENIRLAAKNPFLKPGMEGRMYTLMSSF
jgi:hypothetical protein